MVVRHTDGDREYAYDRDPILGAGTDQVLAAAAEHKWTVIDMAADWVAVARRTVGPLGIDKARLGRYPPADP